MHFRSTARPGTPRRARAFLLCLPLAMLAACGTTTSPIIPTGQPNQYTLTSRSSGFTTSWVELKRQALKRANDYCVSQGLKMTQPDVASNHATGVNRQETYVTFNCEPIPQPKNEGQGQDGKNDQGK